VNREKLVRLGVASALGIGPNRARAVAAELGGWEAAREAAASGRLAERCAHRNAQATQRVFAGAVEAGELVWERSRSLGVEILFRGEARWPGSLDCLTDPPEVLFARGRVNLVEEPSVAIVGTRESSVLGNELTARIAGRLAEEGITVVSGLARGIDAAAHRGALEALGGTIAVPGAGPDRPYPEENRDLHERIALDGLLVTEFPPGTEPLPWNFPRRNRILAGLAGSVLVVEARRRSGALITARHAIESGKDVYVVPGWPSAALSAGPLALLREGARAVRDAEDLLEDLGGISGGAKLEPGENEMLRAVREGVSSEQLASELGLDREEAAERLARLELLGFVALSRPRSSGCEAK
jgi:DNA processing protein